MYGLSPGRLLGAVPIDSEKLNDLGAAVVDRSRRSKSAAVKLWESLLDGPWGLLRILREASCVSEARLTGLSGADAFPDSMRDTACRSPAEDNVLDLVVASLSAGGAVLLRQRPVKPKRLRFFAGDSMVACGIAIEGIGERY